MTCSCRPTACALHGNADVMLKALKDASQIIEDAASRLTTGEFNRRLRTALMTVQTAIKLAEDGE